MTAGLTHISTELAEAIDRLRIDFRRLHAASHHGVHTQPMRGQGLEFRDIRPYAPGDDPRRVDWPLYRRSGTLAVRLYDETRPVRVHVLLDESLSMRTPTPFAETSMPLPIDLARQSAALIAGIALQQTDRVTLHRFDTVIHRPQKLTHVNDLARVFDADEIQERVSAINVVDVLNTLAHRNTHADWLVVISDFCCDDRAEMMLSSLSHISARLALIRAGGPEVPISAAGEYRFVDAESGQARQITLTAKTIARHREALAEFDRTIRTFADEREATYLPISTAAPLLSQLDSLFVNGHWTVVL